MASLYTHFRRVNTALNAIHSAELREERRFAKAQKEAQKAAQLEEHTHFDAWFSKLTRLQTLPVSVFNWSFLRDRQSSAPVRIEVSTEKSYAVQSQIEDLNNRWYSWLRSNKKRKLLRLHSQLVQQEGFEQQRLDLKHREDQEAYRVSVLASKILQGDPVAMVEAVTRFNVFGCLAEHLSYPRFEIETTSSASKVVFYLDAKQSLPEKASYVNYRGEICEKKISASDRNRMYENYVYGATLQVGKIVLATLPVSQVEVSTMDMGSYRKIMLLTMPRHVAERIPWEHTDASEVISHFQHHKSYTKGNFSPIG